MTKKAPLIKKNLRSKIVDNQETKLYLNKFSVKSFLMDNQRNLKLNQNEYCTLNYLVNVSKVGDWSGSYPIVHLEYYVASPTIGAEVSEIVEAISSLENRGFIASIDDHGTYSLLPLGKLLTPHLPSYLYVGGKSL